jgi:hypothetical protein
MKDLRDFPKNYDPNTMGICNFEMTLATQLLLTTAVASTAVSAYSGVKSSEAASKSAELQRKQGQLEEQRQKRELVRRARISRGEVAQSAESQGVAASSAAVGGQASIGSQLGANLSFLDQYANLSDQITKAQTTANNWQAYGQVAGAAASLAVTGIGQGWGAAKAPSAGKMGPPT